MSASTHASSVYLPRGRDAPTQYHTKLYVWGEPPVRESKKIQSKRTVKSAHCTQVQDLIGDKEPDALYAGPRYFAMISKDRQLYT